MCSKSMDCEQNKYISANLNAVLKNQKKLNEIKAETEALNKINNSMIQFNLR